METDKDNPKNKEQNKDARMAIMQREMERVKQENQALKLNRED